MSRTMSRFRDRLHQVGTSLVATLGLEAPLCTTCRALRLRKILRDGLPDSKMITLGILSDIKQRSGQCAFCRLVMDLVQCRWRLDEFPGIDVQGCEFFLSAQACGTLDPNLAEKKQMHRLYIHSPSRPIEIAKTLMARKAAVYVDIQLMQEDSRKVGRSKDLHGRRIKDKVDIRLIKKWISLCETAHGETCEIVWWKSGHEDLPGYVRMIDVVQMALVSATPSCRYLALTSGAPEVPYKYFESLALCYLLDWVDKIL